MNKTNLLSGLEGEERVLISHVMDLAERCEKAGVTMYSPFLNPREVKLALSRCKGNFFVNSFGGYEDSERKILAFSATDEIWYDYPVDAVKISSKDGRVFSHRDYLGSVLSLGIKREKIGDIVVEDDFALVFCHRSVGEYICLNLTKVASANVLCEICPVDEVKVERKFSAKNLSVASLRADAVISGAIGKSREVSADLISKGYVQINYEVAKSSSARIKDGDVISVRGFGKMVVETGCETTKKGRIKIIVKQFL